MKTKNTSNRRALLKIIPSAGVIGALEYWKKPIIQSIVIPTHAQTSNPNILCSSSITVIDNNDIQDLDLAVLAFDPDSGGCMFGSVACVNGVSDISGFMGNAIVGIDIGNQPVPNWDHEVMGDTNWSVTPNLGEDNTNTGFISLIATRLSGASNGVQYDVLLDLSISGTNNVQGVMDISAVITER